MARVTVSGSFDDVRLKDFRLLDEASKRGAPLVVRLWTDEICVAKSGKSPKFPYVEREYLLRSTRFVDDVVPATESDSYGDADDRFVASSDGQPDFPLPAAPECPVNPAADRKKVVVTGCFDWFHSGHVRFFEEVSEIGDLYVVVGHDDNIRLLKGEGHPLFPAVERRYIVGTSRFVKLALISTGDGWMDAEPEIERLKPDVYAVNEDGDRPEKLAFCRKKGIEYRVLRRLPKSGLPRRQSTALRGF